MRCSIRDLLWLTAVVALVCDRWAQQRLQGVIVEWKHRDTAAKSVLLRAGQGG